MSKAAGPDFPLTLADGQQVRWSDYAGQVVLVVNVASRCGFTPQYAGLQNLYQRYRAQGLVVLGFPCRQFAQELAADAAIGEFCQRNYGVEFPIFAPIKVNGPNAHPLYRWLKNQRPGVLGTRLIKWNFTKFLLNRQGQVVARFAPITPPSAIEQAIERLL
ncbi:glutathione peroxidase [Chitinibacter sp. ZOR0017]|uniref:glutathione peroxidase n=1 Tax=Chitinibacter sp. ZOR0017 TaxID=1339254 RepID=UPI0006461ADF|nr:glutathione peroxidase [Chitinibacter sp. ZOR0017]